MVPSAQADLRLSFGLYASEKPTTLVKKFRPIMNSREKQLSSELRTPVFIKLSISKTYEEGIGTLVNGLDKKVVTALHKVLLNFTDKNALQGIRQDGFNAASEQNYAVIHDAINFNPRFFVK